jgi:hypothetical protein
MVYTDVFDFSSPVGTTFVEMLAKINSFTDIGPGGIMGIFILLVVGCTLWLMMKGYGNERAFGVTGLILGVIAVFLRLFSLINDGTLYIIIIFAVVGIILLLKEAANYEQ